MLITDTARFFIVLPLDLEEQGLLELKEKFTHFFPSETFTLIQIHPGGLEIECLLLSGVKLNHVLRTPTRILLRLSEFKCRDFPKLFQKISKFPWASWMIGQIPNVECASKDSRLFDSRKIEKAIQDGIAQYYKHKPVKKRYLEHGEKTQTQKLPSLYFRALNDVCTLSIDTTGERLHLRGEKILTGLAPIRESLASLLLLELRSQMIKKNLADKKLTLIDPMCGSGTFLIEAQKYFSLTTKRDFAFYHFPLILDTPESQMNLAPVDGPNQYEKLLGFDSNQEVVSLAQANAPNLLIEQADLFRAKSLTTENAIVILNPPYGIRVGENINLDYFLKVITAIKEAFSPLLLGIIIPEDFKLKSNPSFNLLKALPFKNGGIEVIFYVLEFT